MDMEVRLKPSIRFSMPLGVLRCCKGRRSLNSKRLNFLLIWPVFLLKFNSDDKINVCVLAMGSLIDYHAYLQ